MDRRRGSTLAVGLAITSAVALALGFITLRMKGHYLPLATIAWGMSLYFLFGNLRIPGRPYRNDRHSGADAVRIRAPATSGATFT